MDELFLVVKGVVGTGVLISIVYILTRVSSIAYFRTKAEYERSLSNEFLNGEDDAEG